MTERSYGYTGYSKLPLAHGSSRLGTLPVVRGFASSTFRSVLASLLVLGGLFMHWLDRSLVADKTQGVAPDLGAYYAATERLLAGASPYFAEQTTAPIDAVCTACYLYPPILAQAIAPLALLPAATASIVWWFTQVTIAFVAVWLATGLGGARANFERAAWCLAVVLWFAPLYDSLRLGNITATIMLGVTLVAFGGAAAGFGSVVSALLKVAPATLLPAAFVMGSDSRRTLVLTMVGAFAVSGFLAPQAWLDYAHVLVNLFTGSVDYSWNFAPANVAVQAGLGPSVVTSIRVLTLVLSGALVLASVFWARCPDGAPAAAFLGALAMLVLPGALWFHYFGVLLPFAAMVWPTARPIARFGLLVSAVVMLPYLVEPLPGVIGALVMVTIIGSSLLRRSDGDVPGWLPEEPKGLTASR